MHPIFSALITRPELVMEHAAGYAALVREEASSLGVQLAKRAVAWGVALFSLLIFAILLGVAVMAWAVLDQFYWSFLVVPGIALAVGVAAFVYARKPLPQEAFGELKAQLDADVQALHAVGAKP